jgi:hypothetical protein
VVDRTENNVGCAGICQRYIHAPDARDRMNLGERTRLVCGVLRVVILLPTLFATAAKSPFTKGYPNDNKVCVSDAIKCRRLKRGNPRVWVDYFMWVGGNDVKTRNKALCRAILGVGRSDMWG